MGRHHGPGRGHRGAGHAAAGHPGVAGGGGVTGRLISDIVIRLLAYVAQLEREKIRERQAQGIAAARARGRHLGRPAIERPDGWRGVCGAVDSGRITRRRAAAYLGVCLSTLDRWRADAREVRP